MSHFIKRFVILNLVLMPLLSPPLAQAQDWDSCTHFENVATIGCLEIVFAKILAVAINLIGILAFVMIIVSSFQFLTAGGDPKKAQAASKTLTMSIFGLVGVFLVYFILWFLSEFTGANLLEFTVFTQNADIYTRPIRGPK